MLGYPACRRTLGLDSSLNRCCSKGKLRNAGAGRWRRGTVRVEGAISRQKKEAIVETVKEKLKDSALVFNMRTKGLTVAQMEELRQSFPAEHTTVYVCKNSLMKIAADQIDGWSTLRSISKKQNAWVFVDEDGIASTVKTWLDFNTKQTKILKDNAEKDVKVPDATEIYGGAFNGKICTPEEVLKFKDLPTRTEVLATLVGMLNSVPSTLLSTINQAPLQLTMNVQQIADLDEEKTKLVREFVKEEGVSDEAS